MGWLEAVLVVAVLAAIVIVAASRARASVIARQKKSRVRGPFLLGVLCGLTVGVALTGRRQGLGVLAASTLDAITRPLRARVGSAVNDVTARALTVISR